MKNGNRLDRLIYWLRTVVLVLAALLILFGIYFWLTIPAMDQFNPQKTDTGNLLPVPYPGEIICLDRNKQAMFRSSLAPGINQSWISIKKVPVQFLETLIALEDYRFFDHNGVDITQLYYAFWENVISWRFKYGGSTITQQLIKNIYLSQEKNLLRKLREIVMAIRIEKKLTKQQILEWYINILELAPGVHGIKEGSLHYFGKLPKDLSYIEQVFLASIIPDPHRYAAFPEEAVMKTEKLAGKLYRLKKINFSQYQNLKRAKFTFFDRRQTVKPAVQQLLENSVLLTDTPQKGYQYMLYTTIDSSLQTKLKQLVTEKRIPGRKRIWFTLSFGDRIMAAVPGHQPEYNRLLTLRYLLRPWNLSVVDELTPQIVSNMIVDIKKKKISFTPSISRWKRRTTEYVKFLPQVDQKK